MVVRSLSSIFVSHDATSEIAAATAPIIAKLNIIELKIILSQQDLSNLGKIYMVFSNQLIEYPEQEEYTQGPCNKIRMLSYQEYELSYEIQADILRHLEERDRLKRCITETITYLARIREIEQIGDIVEIFI